MSGDLSAIRSGQRYLDDIDCTSLNLLARNSSAVATAFGTGDRNDVGNPMLAWLRDTDHVLRDRDNAGAVVALAAALCELKETADWNTFLRAVVLDAKSASDARETAGRHRSLWGTTPIISLVTGVAADRRLGIDAESLVYTTYYVTSAFDINLSDHVACVREAGWPIEEAFYWLVLVWALLSYDIYFFFNDRGILLPSQFTGHLTMGIRIEEMSLLRRAGKVLYGRSYGADYRTRNRTLAHSRFNFCMDCPDVGRFCFCNDETWPLVFYPIAAYATAVLATGVTVREVPLFRRFDGTVIDTDIITPCYSNHESGRNIRVLHVPNHEFFKGTRYLKDAISRLPAGTPIDFEFATGRSNEQVLALMRRCDVVVDQLIGGHFGLTALEAMALGKAVIVYIADWETVVAPDECPLINANPDTIYERLLELAADPAALNEIGRRSRQYVCNHYSVQALAERLRALYDDTIALRLHPAAGRRDVQLL